MFRSLIALFLITLPVTSVVAQAPTPEAANQIFTDLQKQWAESIIQLQAKSAERSSAGTGHSELDHEIEELRSQVEGMIDKIVAAGLDVHRAGVTDDATVNSTLVAIAGFYVAGDDQGDGGDQYEKALPVIKTMLDAGLGDASKELWLWGGVSAFCLNDYELAKSYFSKASEYGIMPTSRPYSVQTPRERVELLAFTQNAALAATQQAWAKEKQIRAAEQAADDLPRVKLHTTRGDVVIELFENEAPIAVANFLTLVKSGYYDDVVFHRVLPAFMAQGGDPTGTGGGGPGYNIRCECHQPNYRHHFRGSLSMAHAGRDTGGSQFFLTYVPTSYLDGRHTVFGRVLEGIDAASALKRRDPSAQGAKPEPDKIVRAHVVRDRGHDYQFEKLPEK